MTISVDKALLLENLRELSDVTVQQRLWVHGSEKIMSSFTEAICGAFDDAGLTRALDSDAAEWPFSMDARRVAKELDRAVSLVPEDQRPEAIVRHASMDEVRGLAGELLRMLERA